MEFLVDAILSESDGTLLGALILHFDPERYTERASVKMYTMQELAQAYPNMKPSGFLYEEPGLLRSDCTPSKVITESVFHYMSTEYAQYNKRSLDVTDLVLLGLESSGFVVANFEECGNSESFIEDAIMIPFSKFKVSNSSFNIYAPYRNSDNLFRTFSLLKLEDGSMNVFYAMFPANVDMSGFGTGVQAWRSVVVNGKTNIIYKVSLGLNGFYVNVGEAFLNFLSYNVAFYNIGEKLIRELQPTTPLTTPSVEEDVSKPRRYARVNVSIEHICKESKLKGILGRMDSKDELVQFIRDFPEANITYQWVCNIYSSPWFVESNKTLSEEESLGIACTNMLVECFKKRLKYALELLSNRYFIYTLGIVNDTLGPVLKGGGVVGQSIKRVSTK